MNRQGFLGGSDMVRIINGDWHKLWLEKTGRVEPDNLDHVFPVQLGILTEDFNLNWFAKGNSMNLVHKQKKFESNLAGMVLRGTIDAAVYTSNDYAIVEAKHTYDYNTMNAQLERYMPQLQFYIYVANANGAYFSNIFGNRRHESVYVSRDNAFIDKMLDHAKIFWQAVVDDEAPAFNQTIDMPDLDKIKIDDMVKRNANQDNHFISVARDYVESIDAAKTNELAKKSLKEMIGDDEREVYCDFLTVKRSKAGSLRITTKKESDDE